MVKYSIIIPVYNTEKYLRRCVDSIVNQLFYGSIEVLLIDDGSTDNSGALCDRLSLEYNNVKVIHTVNGGVSNARNIGLSNVTGQWIMFVDSDDWIDNDALMIIDKCNPEESDTIVYWDMEAVYETSIDNPKRLNVKVAYNVNDFVKNKNPCGSCVVLYNKEIIDKYKLTFTPGCRFGEDQEFLFKYLSHVKKVISVEEVLYRYYIHQDSAVRKTPNHLYISQTLQDCLFRIVKYWIDHNVIFDKWLENRFDAVYKASLIQFCLSKYKKKDIQKLVQQLSRLQKMKSSVDYHFLMSWKLSFSVNFPTALMYFIKIRLLLSKLKNRL